MGIGLPLMVIVLAMAVLVGLVIAWAFKRPRRPEDPRIADILRAKEIPVEMIGGPDCEGCRRADHAYTELNRTKN